jgi:hypothetical protein
MTTLVSQRRQQGVVLAVGLIMLFVITVMVVAAFKLSTINLAAAGNAQFREQAVAAANLVINTEADAPFQSNIPVVIPPDRLVDIDGDGNPEFRVHFNAITCIRASKEGVAASSSVTLPVTMTTTNNYNTVWDFDVTVTDDVTVGNAITGTAVRIHEGVGALLTQAQCNAICPPLVTSPPTPCS